MVLRDQILMLVSHKYEFNEDDITEITVIRPLVGAVCK